MKKTIFILAIITLSISLNAQASYFEVEQGYDSINQCRRASEKVPYSDLVLSKKNSWDELKESESAKVFGALSYQETQFARAVIIATADHYGIKCDTKNYNFSLAPRFYHPVVEKLKEKWGSDDNFQEDLFSDIIAISKAADL